MSQHGSVPSTSINFKCIDDRYFSFVGFCPNMYAFSRLYNYCLGYEGQFLAADGFHKCQEKGRQLPLIRGEAEMRFASLLAGM